MSIYNHATLKQVLATVIRIYSGPSNVNYALLFIHNCLLLAQVCRSSFNDVFTLFEVFSKHSLESRCTRAFEFMFFYLFAGSGIGCNIHVIILFRSFGRERYSYDGQVNKY